jgi:cyclophilin family peptidyl-prolyl cis-trans isomerase
VIAGTRSSLGILMGVVAVLVAVLSPGCGSKRPKEARSVPAHFAGVEAIAAIDEFIAAHPVDKSNPAWKTRVPRPPSVHFDPAKTYYWTLSTSEGFIKIKLRPDFAPRHVTSTVYLTRLGFYDDLTFHRIIPGFMAQGGDPKGTGAGGPGYRYAGEFKSKKAKHDKKGIVSMANSGPRTDGSQFFILFKENEALDGKHTVFGEVLEGKGTLRTMEALGSKSGKPSRPVTIRRAVILAE